MPARGALPCVIKKLRSLELKRQCLALDILVAVPGPFAMLWAQSRLWRCWEERWLKVCVPRAQMDMARLLASGQGTGPDGAEGQPRKRGRGRPLGSKTKVRGVVPQQAG